MARAMKGLRGFAYQAVAGFEKLQQSAQALVPVVQQLADTLGKQRQQLVQLIPVLSQTAAGFRRLTAVMASTAVAVQVLTAQYAGLGSVMLQVGSASLRAVGSLTAVRTAATAAMAATSSGMAAAAASTWSFATAAAAVAIPFALIAAAIGVAYVAAFKWQEVPGWLKLVMLAASPLVVVIRALALAWNAATAPIRAFIAVLGAPFKVATLSVRGLSAAVSGVASKTASTLSSLAAGALSFGKTFARGIMAAGSSLIGFARSGVALGRKLGTFLGGVGSEMSSMAGRIVGPLTDAGRQFAAAGTAATAMATATGLSVQAIGELGYAAEQSGASVEAVAGAVESVNTQLLEAAAGSKSAAEGFEQLGFDVDNLAKINPEQRFVALGVAIAKLESPLDRAAAASKVFGTSNASLIGMFSKGTAGITEMRKEAERLGLVMTGPQATAAKALSEAYKSIQDAVTGLWRTLGAAVAPQLTETATQMAQVIKAATAWVAKNGALIAQIFKWASAITTVGAVLSGVATVLAMLTPAVLTLTASVAAGWLAWGKWGQSAAGALQEVYAFAGKVMAEVGRVVGGVKDAIAGGDLELAARVAWAGVQIAWVEGMAALASVTGPTMEGIFGSLASGNWSDAIGQAWNAIQQVYTQGASALDGVWTGMTGTIDSVITYLRQQINVAIHELARLAVQGVNQVQSLASVLAKYDPTGKIREAQIAVKASLEGSGLVDAARTSPQAANDALGAALGLRQGERDAGLGGRQAGRDEDLRRLGLEQQVAQEKARMDAAQAQSDAGGKLADLLAKAAAARDAAAMRPVADIERRDKLAAAAAPTKAGGGFGATFSGAALVAMSGGGGGVQKEIAVATKATATQVKRLADQDAKRQKEERAFQVVGTA